MPCLGQMKEFLLLKAKILSTSFSQTSSGDKRKKNMSKDGSWNEKDSYFINALDLRRLAMRFRKRLLDNGG